jgi:hypothetical protein
MATQSVKQIAYQCRGLGKNQRSQEVNENFTQACGGFCTPPTRRAAAGTPLPLPVRVPVPLPPLPEHHTGAPPELPLPLTCRRRSWSFR